MTLKKKEGPFLRFGPGLARRLRDLGVRGDRLPVLLEMLVHLGPRGEIWLPVANLAARTGLAPDIAATQRSRLVTQNGVLTIVGRHRSGSSIYAPTKKLLDALNAEEPVIEEEDTSWADGVGETPANDVAALEQKQPEPQAPNIGAAYAAATGKETKPVSKARIKAFSDAWIESPAECRGNKERDAVAWRKTIPEGCDEAALREIRRYWDERQTWSEELRRKPVIRFHKLLAKIVAERDLSAEQPKGHDLSAAAPPPPKAPTTDLRVGHVRIDANRDYGPNGAQEI